MPDCLYHVIANVDTEFNGAAECMAAYLLPNGAPILFEPRVPLTRDPNEDAMTPRIPVCRELTDCFTAIGLLGRFRRCLAANEGAKSYQETPAKGAYPVIVCKFEPSQVVIPSKDQVPDVDVTHELWLTEPTRPVSVELRWLNAASILWDDKDNEVCREVRFVPPGDLDGYRHPWLTGTGCILESSLMDHEWYNSPYRTPMTEAERSAIIIAHASGKSLREIQTRYYPYRSLDELTDALSGVTCPLPYKCRVFMDMAFLSRNYAVEATKRFMDDRAHEAFVGTEPVTDVATDGATATVTVDGFCAAKDEAHARRLMYGLAKDFAKSMSDLTADFRSIRITVRRDRSHKTV